MNLIIDAGNTSIKLAVFKKKEIVDTLTTDEKGFAIALKSLFALYPMITAAIASSVGALKEEHLKVVAVFCELYKLSSESKLPFKNSYATPQTLGVDRMALVAAAYQFNPHKNNLVIDAGTCITYDIITEHDEYLGGAISPGLQMRYNALHQQTAKLPLLQKTPLWSPIGNSTENSIHSGVVNGVLQEIEGVIHQYKSRFKDLTVILTGGDAIFLSNQLKNTIFADSKFLLRGLNYLLEYNKH